MKNRFIRFAFVVFLSSLTTFLTASVSDGDQTTVTRKDKMNAQEYLSKIRNNQNTGNVSISDVMNARLATQALKNNRSASSAFQWTSMGPNNMAGPSKAVIFDNRDASNNTLYAGSNNGGLWKSTNYGATWNKVVMDDVLNVSSIAQAENGTIYVGTGVSLEPAADKISEGSTIGKGIWKSNGDSFSLMEGTAPSGNDVTEDWAFIQKLAVDGSGNLYAATNTGLKYFNGTSWSYAQADGVELIGKSCDVVYGSGMVVAAVAGKTYISMGTSTQFVLESGDEEGMLPDGEFGNIKFAISKSNSNYMYASYVDTDGALYNVYVSTDKGTTWRIVYPGGSSLDDIYNGQGLRNNAVTVHPTNEKTVYLGAYDVYVGYEAQPTGYYDWTQLTNGNFDPYPPMGTSTYVHFGINGIVFNPGVNNHAIVVSDGGISITKDGFASQQLINRGFVTTEYYTINASKAGDVLAGAQFNGLQGILDNGSNQAYELLLNTFGGPSPKTGGYGHVSYINPEFIVASASDGTFWRSEDLGENVNADILSGIEIGSEFITPFAMWETTKLEFPSDTAEFKAFKDYAAGDKIWVSSNSYDFPFSVILEQKLDSGETRLFMDPVGSRSFIAVEGSSKADFDGGVYMTTGMLDYTAAPTWWQIGAVEGIPTCLDYSSDVNYVWVGTLEGRLYRLSNIARANNEEKADINSPGCIIAITEIELPVSQAITSVAIDPMDANNVLVTFGNYGNSEYVMLTTEGKMDHPSFSSIQGNLPQMPVYSSTFLLNTNKAFVGTENGLFYTDNIFASTVTWNYEDAAFGNVPVFALKQQDINWPRVSYSIGDTWFNYPGAANYGALYVGTFGNGAYVTKDFVGFEEFDAKTDNLSSLSSYPNPATDHITISFNARNSGEANIEIYDLSGKLIDSRMVEVNNGNNMIPMDTYQLDNGSYIVRLVSGGQLAQTKLIISK
jgi:hypothetical protein